MALPVVCLPQLRGSRVLEVDHEPLAASAARAAALSARAARTTAYAALHAAAARTTRVRVECWSDWAARARWLSPAPARTYRGGGQGGLPRNTARLGERGVRGVVPRRGRGSALFVVQVPRLL